MAGLCFGNGAGVIRVSTTDGQGQSTGYQHPLHIVRGDPRTTCDGVEASAQERAQAVVQEGGLKCETQELL